MKRSQSSFNDDRRKQIYFVCDEMRARVFVEERGTKAIRMKLVIDHNVD